MLTPIAQRVGRVIPVVVISLERSIDRRAYISGHLGQLGIPFRLFPAVDGSQMPATSRAKFEPTMPAGAMGCAESYLTLLRAIAVGDDEFVCVLEDDAEIAPIAAGLLDFDTLKRLPEFDVLRLESRDRRRKSFAIPIARFDGFDLAACFRHKAATTGQIFTRDGARKIVASISYLRVAIDIALFIDSHVMGLRVIETRPSLVRPHEPLESTIGRGRKPTYSALEIFLQRRMRTRELRNIASFIAAWPVSELVRARLS